MSGQDARNESSAEVLYLCLIEQFFQFFQDMRLHPRTGLPVFGDLAEGINEEKLRLVLCADKDCNATSSVRQVRPIR